MSKIIKLTESDLTNLVKKVLAEQETTNYMFFSNLEQIKRQCEALLEMDPNMIDEIIQDGHDWADDHVSEEKNKMNMLIMKTLMKDVKKLELNYVLVVNPQLKRNLRSTPPHMEMATPYKYVKVK